jgi:hypothetical protein
MINFIHARDPVRLPGVFVWREASEPRLVWPAQRAAVRGLCSEDLLPEMHHAADNARALQDLQLKAGPRYVTALKRERASKRKKGRVVARAAAPRIRFADAELCARPCAWSRCRRAFQRCNTSGRVLRFHLVNSSTIRSAW